MENAKDFFSPQLIGETVHSRSKEPSGVHVYGLVVDPAGFIVAGTFGARSTRMDRFMPEMHIGVPLTVLVSGAYINCRPASAGSYDLFEFEHPEGYGRLAMVVDKTAMLSHPVEAFEERENIRFFATGSVITRSPFLDLWARRLQDLISVAILPEWQQRLWDEMVEEAWIAPCKNYGGFGPVWDVFVGKKEAMEKLLGLIQSKQLQ
ncbi:hypothetical protein KQH40_00800 [bacterium]|nr:hypothetical protein [bacterium]